MWALGWATAINGKVVNGKISGVRHGTSVSESWTFTSCQTSDLPSPWQSLAEEGGNRKRNTERKQGKSKYMNKAANRQNNRIKTTVNVQRKKRAGCASEYTAGEDHKDQLDRGDLRNMLHWDHIRSGRIDCIYCADVEMCQLAEILIYCWSETKQKTTVVCKLGWSNCRFILAD